MSVENYFQTRAEKFHALYGEESPWRYWLNRWLRKALFQRVEITLEELHALGKCTVLDVGCGSGRNSVLFVKAGARRVVGIDFAENMIALARDFSRSHGTESQAEFTRGDFMTMTVAEKFDAAVALGVFDYTADPVGMLRKMKSCVTRKIIASFPAPALIRSQLRSFRYRLRGCPVYFYTREQVDQVAAEAGLKHSRITPLGSAGFMLIGEVAE